MNYANTRTTPGGVFAVLVFACVLSAFLHGCGASVDVPPLFSASNSTHVALGYSENLGHLRVGRPAGDHSSNTSDTRRVQLGLNDGGCGRTVVGGRSGVVRPRVPPSSTRDTGDRHAKSIGDAFVGLFKRSCAYDMNMVERHGGLSVLLANAGPSFCLHVANVVHVGTNEEVVWVDTRRNVASVTNKHLTRIVVPVSHGDAMSIHRAAAGRSETGVSSRLSTRPKPTRRVDMRACYGVLFLDLGHKTRESAFVHGNQPSCESRVRLLMQRGPTVFNSIIVAGGVA